MLKTLRNYADNSDAVRLMGKATVLDNYWHFSMLLFLREEIDNAFSGLEEIEGGMDCLPNALADTRLSDGKTLRDLITFNREVYSIVHEDQGITTTFKNGKTETFPYVICTIPFSVLRRIEIKGLPGSKKIKDAIRGLGYQSSTKVLINCTQRFWEKDEQGEIYGGASLSDSIAQMTFYPSDNAQKKHIDISNGPGVLLGSYTWGADARRLGDLNPQERGKLVVDNVGRFHPQIRDYIDSAEPYASISWDHYAFAAGAFSSPNPNDLQMFFPGASQPAGRLFFAGEHLSPFPSWIQGGLWSALQAVMQLVIA